MLRKNGCDKVAAAPHPLSNALDHASLNSSRLFSLGCDGRAGSTRQLVVQARILEATIGCAGYAGCPFYPTHRHKPRHPRPDCRFSHNPTAERGFSCRSRHVSGCGASVAVVSILATSTSSVSFGGLAFASVTLVCMALMAALTGDC